MNYASLPARFPLAWAADAGGGFINPIPTTSQIGINAGYASLPDGFVPLNSTPIEAGGIPPRIQDWNGILNQLTLEAQWSQAGGPAVYDVTFSTAVGGYPKGALLASQVTVGRWWVNKVDGNATDPDSGGAANWADMFALAFNNITITGAANQLAVGATFTNNGAMNLGNNATCATRTPGDATTFLANTAFVTGAVNAAISYLETWVAANYVSDAYLASLGLATQLYVRTLIDGFTAPAGAWTFANSGGGGGSTAPTISFTAATSGMLTATGSRINSAVDGAAHSCVLFIDGVNIVSDSSTLSMTHPVSVHIAAGAHTVQYSCSGTVQFNSVISMTFTPDPPVY